ncbi:hypothetical protein KIN20_035617 [Parelaphostrongylus tenuis]|uniref:Uncharacterized protein n=1 Tax=Parelaphostrongylus tenuis TaxID=148309 RepID=A0AAD5RBP9_PARTN|nr:hypothetical protein KIN20_035617 [Parelaphostrongylus tenuis]
MVKIEVNFLRTVNKTSQRQKPRAEVITRALRLPASGFTLPESLSAERSTLPFISNKFYEANWGLGLLITLASTDLQFGGTGALRIRSAQRLPLVKQEYTAWSFGCQLRRISTSVDYIV